ncbi:MAG: hypothetical protein ABR524_06680 [Thermoanaerobaculia bacterium]
MNQARPLLIFLLLILTSLSAIAQQASFPIERIEVRGARFASEEVVSRESLIVEGTTYTEAQLRAAMSRINRLPFVLDSTFALEKGTTHGSYVLVVTIVETKPLFIEAISARQRQGGSSYPVDGFRTGLRLFVGSSSLIHAATDFDGNYQAGLTQYNLFGRPGYVSLGVRWTEDDRVSFQSDRPVPSLFEFRADPSPELRFGFPVFGDHSIVGSWQHDSGSVRVTTETESRYQKGGSDRGELAWVFDTTDDPLLPTSGTLWRSSLNLDVYRSKLQGTYVPGESHSTSLSFFSGWERHVPLNGWVSVNYGLGAGIGRFERESEGRPVFGGTGLPGRSESAVDTLGYSASAGLSSSLWSDRLTRKYGDLRFQAEAEYFGTNENSDEVVVYGSDRATLELAIVQRNVWGTLRLAFNYDRVID